MDLDSSLLAFSKMLLMLCVIVTRFLIMVSGTTPKSESHNYIFVG